ncbi:MAG: zinc dependent phospholipase C family protein [Fibromonadaceae bacterium]|jgi:hypothetical protein|nr:zinc dependent phospholipase C family protein [Fibromonadaceae bacterium]
MEEDLSEDLPEDLPIWEMALLASPDSFGVMPAGFTPELMAAKGNSAENEIAESKEKNEFYYAAIKTQLCVDSNLSFSGGLATAYFRNSENDGEKIFLQGNIFLSKIAKAIFEKDKKLFAKTCETSKDKNYFMQCVKALEEQGFAVEKADNLDRNSWLSLFKAVLLLTEEYFSTKCELPNLKVIECKDNDESSNDLKIIFVPQNTDEKQLKDAALLPLEPALCSSDFLCIDPTFFKFLNENFPYKNDEKEFVKFLKRIYDEKVCKKLWPMPTPKSIRTGIMEANKMGAYKDKKIYINHRLALDSLRDSSARFTLLITMLHEYGHFLDDVLHERADITGDSEGEEGKNFASKFLEYSPSNLLNTDFKFADLSTLDQNVEDQTFSLEINDLSYKRRKEILCLFEYGEDMENGSLKLPNGDTIDDVEFFGSGIRGTVNKGDNFASATHQKLTKAGAKHSGIKFTQELEYGSIWPDFPSEKPLAIDRGYAILVLSEAHSVSETDIVYKSHFGENQYWHSMCPKLKNVPKNDEVRSIILKQCEKWYSDAWKYKQEGKKNYSDMELGKLCHMLQDSFVLAHCWRRYIGDEKFIDEDKIEREDHGKIWTFQDYAAQDGNYHGYADSPVQANDVETIGYKSAERATEQIMLRFNKNLKWHERYSTLNSPKDYLSKVYELCSGRADKKSGGSHPWFKKNSDLSINQLRDSLTKLSMEVENE